MTNYNNQNTLSINKQNLNEIHLYNIYSVNNNTINNLKDINVSRYNIKYDLYIQKMNSLVLNLLVRNTYLCKIDNNFPSQYLNIVYDKIEERQSVLDNYLLYDDAHPACDICGKWIHITCSNPNELI